MRPSRLLIVIVLLVGLVALLAAAPLVLSPFLVRVGMAMLLAAGFAVSWYILGGFAAYYSFGHTAFIGIGAFAAAFATGNWKFTHWAAQLALGMGAAAAASALVAAVIAWPILRLRGHYFTIAMLAVALVCAEVVSAFPLFKGAIGLSLPNIAPMTMRVEMFFYWLALAVFVIVFSIAYAVSRSALGYGLYAIREDEDAAQMLGVPTTRFKVIAFVISASLTGMLGAVYAWNLGYITTDSVFRGLLSLEMIINSLVGGMGSLFGPVVGAIAMTTLAELVLADLLDYRLAISGVIIVAVVLLAPDGLIGLFARWRARRAPTEQVQ